MANDRNRTDAVAACLKRLEDLCDSGFALAIHIRLTAPTILYQTYDRAWAETYSMKGYMLSDPVVHWGLAHEGRVQWQSLADQDPEGVLSDAVAHGLLNGWTYAVGRAGDRTIAGLTRSDRPHDADEVAEIEALVDRLHHLTEGFDHFPAAEQDALRRLR